MKDVNAYSLNRAQSGADLNNAVGRDVVATVRGYTRDGFLRGSGLADMQRDISRAIDDRTAQQRRLAQLQLVYRIAGRPDWAELAAHDLAEEGLGEQEEVG